MFLWADLAELVRHPFSALRVIDARRRLADGLAALALALVDALLKIQGNARLELQIGQLQGLLGLAIFLWQNALLVLATRQHYGLSTERAVAAVVGPIGVVVVLVVALIILAVVFAIITQPPPPL